ncbi:MAG: hypothetical protein JRH20_23855 [Deltaproteobacteria bacterium]|nr:hypothetical protein [Deltaproteobacteria bacterium]
MKNRLARYALLGIATGALLTSSTALARTIVCKGNQQLRIANKTLTRVIASGNCGLTLTNCTIQSPKIAIRASNNATVRLRGCEVSGTRFAIRASQNATVKVTRSTVRGAMRKTENADITRSKSRFFKHAAVITRGAGTHSRGSHSVARGGGVAAHAGGGVAVHAGPGGAHVRVGDTSITTGPRGAQLRTGGAHVTSHGGGAHVRGGGARLSTGYGGVVVSAQKPRAKLRSQGAFVCAGSKDLVIRNRYISARGTAVLVKGACTLKLIGVRVQGSGDVILRDTYVQGRKGAVVVAGSGDVYASRSTLYGGVKTGGSGDFHNKGRNVIKKRW